MIVDMHMHTIESDGEHSPSSLVRMAKAKKIDVISITDHDSSKGVKEAIEEGKKIGVKVIPGIEFSASDPDSKKMHILGYNIHYDAKEFVQIYSEIVKDIEVRNEKMVAAFQSQGIDITLDELKEMSKSVNIRKPVFAKLLLKKGYINKIEDAYTNFFDKEPYRSVKKDKSELNPKQIIEIINRFGGKAVLAHPYSLHLDNTNLVKKIDELRSYGLEGIECFHSRQTKEEMEFYEKIALEKDMIITKGSDFHGVGVYKDTMLATGNNDNLKNIRMDRLNRIDEIIG